MKEYKSYTLEDGTEYILYDTVVINEIKYILFSDVDNPANICFRKEENDEFVSLNEEEYANVLTKLLEKNKNLF